MIGSADLPLEPIDYVIFAMMACIGPYGSMPARERHIKEIENKTPDFLRDVAERKIRHDLG